MNPENKISIKPGHKTGRYACYSDCEHTVLVAPTHPGCVAMTKCRECHKVVDYQRVTPGPRLKLNATNAGAVSAQEEEENYYAQS